MTANLAIAQLLLSTFLVAVTLIWGIFRYRRRGPRRRGTYHRLQAYLLWTLSALIAISCFFPLAYLYTEHLWFESLGYVDVFWGLQKIRWSLFGICFLVAAGFMNVNAAIANVLCPESREFRRWTHTQTFSFHRTVVFITLIVALLLATPMLLLDDVCLRYLYEAGAEVAPTADALHFGLDRNFYLFSFPMHKWVSLWIGILVLVTCVVVGLLYNFYYRRDARTMGRVKRHIIYHGSVLWLLLLVVNGWWSYVNLWGKVYTRPLTKQLTTVHGLFYMDVHLEGATKIYCGVLITIAIVILFNIFWRRRLLWYATGAVWALSYVLLIHAYPIGVHVLRLRVDPYPKEAEYLQRHINETRLAFELDQIQTEKQVEGLATLELIKDNDEIKNNIQLWDRRVLYEALREKQIVRHYNFHPYTDVDRYTVDGQYRQVLIAAREVDPSERITDWYTLKTQYTYGYGVCVAPVNEFVDNGYPNFWVMDTPVTYIDELKVDELKVDEYPQIYYGEMTHDYAVVKTLPRKVGLDEATEADSTPTKMPEWQLHKYEGDGGIPIGGWFRRLCFALRFDFFPILLSDRMTPESRIMFRRKVGTRRGDMLIRDRVSHIAPFLNYDPDPYIVINNGQLYWIIDFYVTSRYYPNSQMYIDDTAQLTGSDLYDEPDFDTFNYIRNSGVAVVNAYTGAVNFYAVKKDEEVLQTYRKAFPNLFKPVTEMPKGLRAHLRYPDYLTRIQATLYGDYHQEAALFFASVDTWSIPKEAYYSSEANQEMMPYYAMLKLPGEDKAEFVNVIPFTPPDKEKRLRAWMVARCDEPHYGERIVYTLDADVPGPTQVEEDINKEIGLKEHGWEKTSDVIRGNLLIIPIEGALFYVEAIYLQAKKPKAKKGEKAEGDQSQPRRPTLEMVIVKAGSSELGTAKTFDEALDVIFLGAPVNGEAAANGEKPLTAQELWEQYRQKRAESDRIFEQFLENINPQDR